MRHMALRTQSTDFVETGRRCAMNVVDDLAVETRALFEPKAIVQFNLFVHFLALFATEDTEDTERDGESDTLRLCAPIAHPGFRFSLCPLCPLWHSSH